MSLPITLSVPLGVFLFGILLFGLQLAHLFLIIRWTECQTAGLRYCGLTARGRRRFKRILRTHALLLSPILGLTAKLTRFQFANSMFSFQGVAAPRAGACSEASFANAVRYQPTSNDLFVVTQMRCGTTWMQHVVLQTLTRGNADLADDDTTLNAISPWLESHNTVCVEEAPLVGEDRPTRIIKTHLPASICPFDDQAKYIYVIRHPVSCFASCVDFVRNNMHGFQIDQEELLRWFTSEDLMWWNTWVNHVDSWWSVARQHNNVIFVRFEDMKTDLDHVVQRVATHLDIPALETHELAHVRWKCSFEYMQQNSEVFEMHAPHLLQIPDRFFVNGKANRFADITPSLRQRVSQWCQREMAQRSFPIDRFYPELSAIDDSLRTSNTGVLALPTN